ncbi:hypothetical protein B0H15DRAFT_949348 [Mycena belliarum]|uniref:Uncharacterized protein n=1 Tax=Mycena belliarum TaxID=1033014 RepID=A0AAD6XS03_9AGAR|nr:hypothetical protein B0H15DRAFT_949348 [Mycena belliae]
MRLASSFLIFGALAILSFVSALHNVTLDDTDPAIIYSAGWNVLYGNALDFGGTLHSSDDSSASASLKFRGVAVYLIAPLLSSSAGAQVVIDDQAPFIIDLQDHGIAAAPDLGQETLRSQVVWAATSLPYAEHTLVISMPPATRNLILDGLIYSVPDDADSLPPVAEPSTSFVFTTITTTSLFTSPTLRSSFSASALSSVQSTTTSSSQPPSFSDIPTSLGSGYPQRPVNAATPPLSPAILPTTTASAAKGLSTSTKRTIAISSVFGVSMIILLIVTLLTFLRRRRTRQRRRERLENWSQKFTPYPYNAARIARASPRTPAANPPATTAPLRPPGPLARQMPRSPLATAAPITASAPSPTTAKSSAPLSAPLLSSAPASPLPPPQTPGRPWSADKLPRFSSSSLTAKFPGPLAAPPSATLMSPAPTSPLPPPPTPGTPRSARKSPRFSSSSAYSDASTSEASGGGYGWTTPSLVGIHPFSAPAEPEPSASSGGRADPEPRRRHGAQAELAPRLDEKSAAALFRIENMPRLSAAPAYREKDAARLFAAAHARTASSSQSAPPLYQP